MNIHKMFKPDYTPKEMFELGIFEGNYFNEKLNLPKVSDLVHLPESAKLMIDNLSLDLVSTLRPDKSRNHFNVTCGSDYETWSKKGWINSLDPYGWVNWYLSYFYGRRSDDDARQIKRWKAFKIRHLGMLKKYPNSNKIKQGLLNWAIKEPY